MRKKRLMMNTMTAMLNQIVAVVCSMILPSQVIKIYGSETNGLVQSITQFLSFVMILDMGVSTVVQSALYKPIALEHKEKVSCILSASRRFFAGIAKVLVVYTILLAVIYPLVIETSMGVISTSLLIITISISMIFDYLFGITSQVLLNADQRTYVQLGFRIGTNIINMLISVLLMHAGWNIVLVKLISSIVFLLRPIGMQLYITHHYEYNFNARYDKEPIPEKMSGMAHHISAFVFGNTDIAILTIFSTLENVSVYSVYTLVLAGLNRLYAVLLSGVFAVFGDMYARNESEQLKNTFMFTEWLSHAIVTIVFADTAVLLVDFVLLYTAGVTDINYSQPVFAIILTLAYALCCVRNVYNGLIISAGKYKETQHASIIQAIINITVSLLLLGHYGINGLAIGTLLSVLYQQVYYYIYIHNNIIFEGYDHIFKQLLVDFISVGLIILLSRFISISNQNYEEWAKSALEVFSLSIVVGGTMNYLAYRENCRVCLSSIRGLLRR